MRTDKVLFLSETSRASCGILSSCAPLNDFDRAVVRTHYTQNALAPSQVCQRFSLHCPAKNNTVDLPRRPRWCEWAWANSFSRGRPVWDFETSHPVSLRCARRSVRIPLCPLNSTCPVYFCIATTSSYHNSFWQFPKGIKGQICIDVGCVSRLEQDCTEILFPVSRRNESESFGIYHLILEFSLGELSASEFDQEVLIHSRGLCSFAFPNKNDARKSYTNTIEVELNAFLSG